MTVDEFLSLLERVKRNGGGWIARCPAHEDRNPSLSIGEGDKGIVLHCHAGCSSEAIVAAVGVELRELFHEPLEQQPPGRPRIVETYDYTDEDGAPLFQAVRFDPKDFRQRRPDGSGGWTWNLNGTRRVLYRLPRIRQAISDGTPIYVVEGEKDVHAIERAGGVATTNPMGAGKWRHEYGDQLVGAAHVIVVADRDDTGRSHAQQVAVALTGRVGRVDIVEPAAGKDISDHLAAGRTLTDLTGPVADPTTEPTGFDDPTITLAEFIAKRSELDQEPIITCDQGAILPAGGLALLVGRSTDGKTTQAIDFLFHAAAGLAYAGLQFPRPLRILIIENEGPREAFRQKLEARTKHWPHEGEPIRLWDDENRWGLVRLSDNDTVAVLRAAVQKHRIDLVVSDTLTRFGVKGNGTPEETRDFMLLLAAAGLGRDVAFLLLHHHRGRPDPSEDEMERIAGAWVPHADAIFTLKKLPGNRARLSYTKLRWTRGQRPAAILAFDPKTESFTHVADESDEHEKVTPETYEQRVLGHLREHPWEATEDLDKCVTGRAQEVRAARQRLAADHKIISAPSAQVGRPGKGLRWNLAPQAAANPVPIPGTDTDEHDARPAQAGPTPSPRPHIRREGVGDGRGTGFADLLGGRA